MARVDIDWHGDEIEHLTEAALQRAVLRGLQPIADLADERVLVQTGELKRSQVVSAEGNRGAVTYTDSKAVGAHENLTVRPRRGKQAKFLESAMHEKAGEAIREVAARLRDVL